MALTAPVRIAVVGAGAADPAAEEVAETVGREIGRAGAVLVCGGLGGVMAAAARGAAAAGGVVVGILPGDDAAAANPWVTIPVPTGMGHARNVIVVATGDAVIALPGAAGTRSEVALAEVLGRPVVPLDYEGRLGGRTASARSAADAVARALTLAQARRSQRPG